MIYTLGNFPKNLTAAPSPVAVSTIKTLLQFKPLIPCRIVEVHFSGNASAAATPGTVELIETDNAATVTAFVAADITPVDAEALQFNSGDPTASLISVGTTASGYTASGENTPTVVRNLIVPQLIAPTSEFVMQIPLGQEGYVQANKFFRIRATFGASASVLCGIKVAF